MYPDTELYCSLNSDDSRSNVPIYIHAISDYKKRLYKKRLVVFVDIKKRRLVRISHAKKRNILQYFQNALSRE